jgi:hypothetical protein
VQIPNKKCIISNYQTYENKLIMRTYILTLFLGLGVFFQVSLYSQASAETYCNNRFGFCVTYPTEVQAQQSDAINGDGIILSNADGDITINISGSHNVMDWSMEKIFNFTKEDFGMQLDTEVNVISSDIQSDGFEATMEAGDQMEVSRMWALKEIDYLVITITGPKAKQADIERLWKTLDVSFGKQ